MELGQRLHVKLVVMNIRVAWSMAEGAKQRVEDIAASPPSTKYEVPMLRISRSFVPEFGVEAKSNASNPNAKHR